MFASLHYVPPRIAEAAPETQVFIFKTSIGYFSSWILSGDSSASALPVASVCKNPILHFLSWTCVTNVKLLKDRNVHHFINKDSQKILTSSLFQQLCPSQLAQERETFVEKYLLQHMWNARGFVSLPVLSVLKGIGNLWWHSLPLPTSKWTWRLL